MDYTKEDIQFFILVMFILSNKENHVPSSTLNYNI